MYNIIVEMCSETKGQCVPHLSTFQEVFGPNFVPDHKFWEAVAAGMVLSHRNLPKRFFAQVTEAMILSAQKIDLSRPYPMCIAKLRETLKWTVMDLTNQENYNLSKTGIKCLAENTQIRNIIDVFNIADPLSDEGFAVIVEHYTLKKRLTKSNVKNAINRSEKEKHVPTANDAMIESLFYDQQTSENDADSYDESASISEYEAFDYLKHLKLGKMMAICCDLAIVNDDTKILKKFQKYRGA